MRCRTVRKKMSPLMDGEVAPPLRMRLQGHLEGCAACRGALAEARALFKALGQAPAPPPVPRDFSGRVMALASERSVRASRAARPLLWRSDAPPALRWATAAMLAAGLALGAMMATDMAAPPRTPAAAAAPGGGGSDFVTMYAFDTLSDSPEGSLANAYLSLADSANGGGL